MFDGLSYLRVDRLRKSLSCRKNLKRQTAKNPPDTLLAGIIW
jgi:hypothetical protein